VRKVSKKAREGFVLIALLGDMRFYHTAGDCLLGRFEVNPT